MYLRYLIWDEEGALLRKVASRIEADVYLAHGCTLTVLPKPKNPTPSQMFMGALELVGESIV